MNNYSKPSRFLLMFFGLTEYEELRKSLIELAVIILLVLVIVLVALIYLGIKIKRIEERIGKEESLFERLLKEKKNTIVALALVFNIFVLAFSVLLGLSYYRYITYEIGIMLFLAYLILSYVFYTSYTLLGIISSTFSTLVPFILGFINPAWYTASALISLSALTAEAFYFQKEWRKGQTESN